MGKKFAKTETDLRILISETASFNFRGKKYYTKVVGKPSPPKGECKTDIYILAEDENAIAKEFKISVKQRNADFLENKMRLERATEIFGESTNDILSKSITSIKEVFEEDYLVYFGPKDEKRNKITLGWKFEVMNKKSGKKSGKLLLSDQQKAEIYSGKNLSNDKKHSKVNRMIYENSGVANYILEVDSFVKDNAESYINQLQSIEKFVKGKDLYFACKALNYRVDVDKWDGNRPLAVHINWYLEAEKLNAEIIYDKPLQIKGNAIGEEVRKILGKLNLGKSNFGNLEQYLEKSIRKKKY